MAITSQTIINALQHNGYEEAAAIKLAPCSVEILRNRKTEDQSHCTSVTPTSETTEWSFLLVTHDGISTRPT